MQALKAFLFLIFAFQVHAADLAPEFALFTDSLQCTVESGSLSIGECGSKQSCLSAEYGEASDYFEKPPYYDCAVAICGERHAGIGSNVENAEILAQDVRPRLDEELDKPLQDFFSTLQKKTKEAEDALNSDPNFKTKLDKSKTAEALSVDFLSQVGRFYPQGLPENLSQLGAIKNQMLPGWSDALFDSVFRLVKKRENLIKSSDAIKSLNGKFSKYERIRHLMGDYESKIRSLPDDNIAKNELLLKLFNLQSTLVLNQDIGFPASFRSQTLLVAVNVEIQLAMENDPESQALKEQIYQLATEERRPVSFYEEFYSENELEMFKMACTSHIVTQYSQLPTEEERDQVIAKVERDKTDFFRRMREKFSRETAGVIAQKVRDMDVTIPPSREEYLERMKSLMIEKTGYLKSRSPKELAALGSYYSGFAPGNIANDQCLLPVDTVPNAYAITNHVSGNHSHSHDNISLGGQIISDYENVGSFVFAHEMGHIVSWAIKAQGSGSSKGGMKKAKECLKSMHTGGGLNHILKSLKGDGAANGLMEEEDYADLFAFVARPSAYNQACAFIHEGRSFFQGTNELHGDGSAKHSPDLFRLLHAQKFTPYSMPQACQNELRANNENVEIKNCWKGPSKGLFDIFN